MIKIFDKAISLAPFLQSDESVKNHQRNILILLGFMLLSSSFFVGIAVLINLLISYITATCLVWCYKFFNKNVFFNTDSWLISIFIYVLFLSPQISLFSNILGVVVMIVFGVGIFSAQGRPIINPVLLGIVVAGLIDFSYKYPITPTLPYLFPLVYKANAFLGVNSFWISLKDANYIIAGMPEYSFLYQNNLSGYLDLIRNYYQIYNDINIFYLLLMPYTFTIGFGSLAVVIIVYIGCFLLKVVNWSFPIIYVIVYILVQILFSIPKLSQEDIAHQLIQSFLLGVPVLLLVDKSYFPNNQKGKYVVVIIASILSGLLMTRSLLIINHLFSFIISGLFVSLIELMFRSPVFGTKNKQKYFALSNIWNRIGQTPNKKSRLFISLLMVLFICIIMLMIKNNTLYDQEKKYFKNLILNTFNEQIVQIDIEDEFFKVISADNRQGVVLYSQYSLYRNSIEIFVWIQDGIILDIEIIDLKTAYAYVLPSEWKNIFINKNIDQLEQELLIQRNDREKDFVLVTLEEAVLKSLSRYTNRLMSNKGG